MAKIEDIKRVAKFLKESVKQLEREGSSGCYNIVCPGVYGDLRVVVGWTGGYDEGDPRECSGSFGGGAEASA